MKCSFNLIYIIYIVRKKLYQSSCCGVVVITLVLHTKGPQFDPGQQHLLRFILCSPNSQLDTIHEIILHNISYNIPTIHFKICCFFMRKADNKFYFEIYFSFIKYFPSFFFI